MGMTDMHTGTMISLGIGAAAAIAIGAGVAAATRAQTSGGDDPYPTPDPYPGGDTSPGDQPLRMPIRGRIDPPGIWDDYGFDGTLRGDRLEATVDPRGWGNDIRLRGHVDDRGFRTEVDPAGWGNTTDVSGRRTAGGFAGTVDRPGFLNDVNHVISETMRGAHVVREGRFDESFVPRFSEAVWRSAPNGSGIQGRTLEFDPPGWGNTTRVTIEANAPAGVEATLAATLFDQWKTEQERLEDYPDPGHPGGTAPGDDPGGTAPGDDPWAPGYPDDYPIN